MRQDEIPDITPESIAERLRATTFPDHAHVGAHETVREADYRGHHIVVRTSYAIEVDGKAIEGHLGVTDDGNVHYHPVPNLAFPSAIDMVKSLIDAFPDDFEGAPQPPDSDHDHEAGHADHDHDAADDHDHDAGAHSGHQH